MAHKTRGRIHRAFAILALIALTTLTAMPANADVVTRWNETACKAILSAAILSPTSYRIIAAVQVAVRDAVDEIVADPELGDAAEAEALEAAVAEANATVLAKLVPAVQAAIDSARAVALSAIDDPALRARGIAAGERAAAAALARCATDGADAPPSWRPRTPPGVYVPTTTTVAASWPGRRPWRMERPDQFRPQPPPDLTSERWARDYEEIRMMGAREGSRRSPEQTTIARFWEATSPAVYYPLVRSVADTPGRDPQSNARLLASVAQAMDDALIAVFDAKYHYGFWRPVTAIRSGDRDGNDATVPDTKWLPLIETPMHPEYPCAHCVLSAALATVLDEELGSGAQSELATTSPTAPGVTRRYANLEAFVQEVASARIFDGVHYRNSTEVGTAMGREVGRLFVTSPRADAK